MRPPIPKRIIQTGKNSNLPVLAKASLVNMQLLHPDFEYLFFDDQQVEQFIDTHFPEYRPTVEAFPLRIQRYDFFRYLAVYKLGGFYFDMDIFLASSVSDLLDCGCVFPFERLTWSDYLRDNHGMDWEIGNYAFGSSAGHPFMKAVIENCVRSQTDPDWKNIATASLPGLLRSELEAIYTTGPGMVSRTLAEYKEAAAPIKVLFPENVCDKNSWNMVGSHGIHLGEGSWRVRHTNLRRRILNFFGKRNEARAVSLAKKLGPKRPLNGHRQHLL